MCDPESQHQQFGLVASSPKDPASIKADGRKKQAKGIGKGPGQCEPCYPGPEPKYREKRKPCQQTSTIVQMRLQARYKLPAWLY